MNASKLDSEDGRTDPPLENIFTRNKDSLERILQLCEREGVNVQMAAAYEWAKKMERDAAEMRESLRSPEDGTPEEIAAHDVWHEWNSQRNALMDDPRDEIGEQMGDVFGAMVAIYGQPPAWLDEVC